MFDVVYSILAATMALLLLVTIITAPRRSGAGPVLIAAGSRFAGAAAHALEVPRGNVGVLITQLAVKTRDLRAEVVEIRRDAED